VQIEAEEVDDVTEKYKVESVPTVLFLKVRAHTATWC
jgi:hypothetical protein